MIMASDTLIRSQSSLMRRNHLIKQDLPPGLTRDACDTPAG
jgi:hypothetical protein